MTPNKINFKSKYRNTNCSLCKDDNSEESLSHLLICPFLSDIPELFEEARLVKCEDIFRNIEKQVKAVKYWEKVLKIYEKETV